ncbi:unnamed protein product [Camellia sinensis]
MSSSRVLIPNNVRNMIQDIREITGKHSDEDIYTVLKDCNMDPNETAQRLLYLDTFHEVKRKRDPRKLNLNNRVYEESRWTTGTQGRGARGGRVNYSSSYFSHGAGGGRNVSARKENGVSNSMERDLLPFQSMGPHMFLMAVPVMNVAPNHLQAGVGVKREKVKLGSHLWACTTLYVSGVYSSTSDPVVVAPLGSQIPSMGAIKCEINSQRIAAESGAFNSSGKRSSKLKESQILEKNQPLEPSEDDIVAKLKNVVASEAPTLAVEAVLQSLPDVSFLEEATSKVDMKLEKLNISTRQPVIFPDHLQVPEDFKNGLIFGSLDAAFEESVAYVDGTDDMKSAMPAIESFEGNDKVAKETFSSNPIVFSTAHEGDYPNDPHSPPHEPDNSSPVKNSVSSGTAPEFEQSKQENMLRQVGPQYPFVHTAPSYGFPYIQPMLGSQLVQCEGSEIQSGNSSVSSTSDSKATATQPIGQSSIPISPPPFPVFRQPYPVNYFPFGTYFPPFYLAANAPQFLGHSGFPQQPSTGNVYLSPIVAAAAGPGVKFSVPQNKAGHNAGNLTHFGIPSGFGSYNPSLAVNSGSSAGNEDLTASELKENSVHTTVQQRAKVHLCGSRAVIYPVCMPILSITTFLRGSILLSHLYWLVMHPLREFIIQRRQWLLLQLLVHFSNSRRLCLDPMKSSGTSIGGLSAASVCNLLELQLLIL